MFNLTAAQRRTKPSSASSSPTCHQVTTAEKAERLLYSRRASSDMFLLVSVVVCLTRKFATLALSHIHNHVFFFSTEDRKKKGQAPRASAHKHIVLALGNLADNSCSFNANLQSEHLFSLKSIYTSYLDNNRFKDGIRLTSY